jgi:short-subunit dehydrogenase
MPPSASPPAVNNQVILVTGATDGLGKRVARDLAAQGTSVLLHGRSREKGEATLEEIREATGNRKLVYYNADSLRFEVWPRKYKLTRIVSTC